MVKTCFQISFTSDYRSRKQKLDSVIECLKNELPELSEDDLFELRVIYNELITNAVVHGNKLDLTKKVELLIEIDNHEIVSVVKDEGTGFDSSKLFHTISISDTALYEHGRGLKLVLGLADFVAWNDTGNEIMFLKKIPG